MAPWYVFFLPHHAKPAAVHGVACTVCVHLLPPPSILVYHGIHLLVTMRVCVCVCMFVRVCVEWTQVCLRPTARDMPMRLEFMLLVTIFTCL